VFIADCKLKRESVILIVFIPILFAGKISISKRSPIIIHLVTGNPEDFIALRNSFSSGLLIFIFEEIKIFLNSESRFAFINGFKASSV
jgi:hypothetical protein